MVFDVYGQRVKVKFKKLEDEHGHYNYKEKAIYIDTENNEGREMDDTLLHELIHAVFHRLGLHAVISGELEETICQNLPAIILDNADITWKKKSR